MDYGYSLRKLILKNIFVLAIIYIFIAFLSAFYYINQTKIFQAKSVIQVDSGNVSGNMTSSIQPLFFGSSQIEEESLIYRSKDNISSLINLLYLDVLVDGDIFNFAIEEYFTSINIEKTNEGSLDKKPKFFNLKLLNNGYEINSANEIYPYNQINLIEGFSFYIERIDDQEYANNELNLTKLPKLDAINLIESSLTVNPF